ncbi:hypothetical protein [Frigidibacter sp. ROC022]|uniref:hypothetical protein n=1 Tax=Frigidibacter sp. ROC022 TaxID=2971796 RepID=UPI00215B174A|nr:hypothetical protein [Frigidibacter sp. ROC022]MCR8724728.1 hypothetical protein [Frigidibacter sp. ROC022]
MPLPLAAIAPVALRYGLRYGSVALATWAVARAARTGTRDQKAEDALDRMPEGMTARREPEQGNATLRLRRVLRRRPDGPGLEIDLAALGRFRIRKV